jgi:DNA repair photolyase
VTGFRWKAADGDEPVLFTADELFVPDLGTGRMSDLEFLHVTAKRILNHVPAGSRAPTNWTINVYRGCSHACSYCFARPTHAYLGFDIGADFDRKIVVKINAVEKLRAELADPGWRGEPVAMGTNTDPYQRAEAKYRLTRGVLEALTEHRNPFSILTKSPLVTRDLDVITAAAAVTDVSVNFSLGTLDERVWRLTEPGAPHPRRRVEAMARLAEAGIRTGALVAPILPGLSDRPESTPTCTRTTCAATLPPTTPRSATSPSCTAGPASRGHGAADPIPADGSRSPRCGRTDGNVCPLCSEVSRL